MPGGSPVQGSVRVFVAEMKQALADRLRVLSDEYSDLVLVGVASSGHSAVASAPETYPDVVLVDGQLADPDAVAICTDIQRRIPGAAIILIGGAQTDLGLLAAVEAGACGVVSPLASDDDLVVTILRAGDGEFLLPRLVVQRLFRLGRELRSDAARDEECNCHPTSRSGAGCSE